MKKYSLLIIAWYANIFHISEFIRNLKKTNSHVEISLMTVYGPKSIPEDVKALTAEIVCFRECSKKIKNAFFRECINLFLFIFTFIRQSKKRYNIVDIHYARPQLAYAMHWIKKLSHRIVISPWGSDVMRIEGKDRIRRLTKVYSCADFVTVAAESQIGLQVMEKFKVTPDKMVKLGWGGEFFDFIQEHSVTVTTEEAKARFGLSGRYVITCGYNSQRMQRHEDIIEAVYGVRDRLPSNLTLLFPFTYGRPEGGDAYTDRIKEKGKELGFDLVSVEEHLDMSDLLKLRMATDIFVHVQTTDAGSRCVMEYVACNKKVVHGAWNKYVYLDKYRPSCYFPVNRMEELGECIVKACLAEVDPLPEEVENRIMERGWKHKMALWNAFFESLLDVRS